MTLSNCLLLAAALFSIGVYGLLTRRQAIAVLLSLELMANAANIASWPSRFAAAGQPLVLFALAITVAEVAVGLALVMLLYRAIGDTVARSRQRGKAMTLPDRPGLRRALFAPAAAALLLVLPRALRGAAPAARRHHLGLNRLVRVRRCWLLFDRLGGAPGALDDAVAGDGGRPSPRSASTSTASRSSMLFVVTLVALCVQVFSVRTCTTSRRARSGGTSRCHALFLFSMNLLVLAPNLLQLFAGWELVGLTSYLLIGFYFAKPSAAKAAVKAFWMTKLADMGFLFGLLVLFVGHRQLRVDAHARARGARRRHALLFLAVVGKSAQFPLHVWLPDAMEGPTPVSALLHAATMVAAGVFLIVRATRCSRRPRRPAR
jgi:NADH:ubiquinone oxidoreductase subunit K